jgi:hypothetical protein
MFKKNDLIFLKQHLKFKPFFVSDVRLKHQNLIEMPSSVIKHYSYEPEKSILYITFVSGITYAYKSVSVDIFNMFKASGSKGRYFNHFIKGHFSYKKIRNKLNS